MGAPSRHGRESPLFYRILPTVWGAFGIVVGDDGRVRATYLPQPEAKVRRRCAADFPQAVESPDCAGEVCRQVQDYFQNGSRLGRVRVNYGPATPFRERVWEACRRIPFGKTASYADLARAVGNPAATRAVGSAMANNPLPLIVPCHRVLRSDGSLGGFSSPEGAVQKRRLLLLENPSLAAADPF